MAKPKTTRSIEVSDVHITSAGFGFTPPTVAGAGAPVFVIHWIENADGRTFAQQSAVIPQEKFKPLFLALSKADNVETALFAFLKAEGHIAFDVTA